MDVTAHAVGFMCQTVIHSEIIPLNIAEMMCHIRLRHLLLHCVHVVWHPSLAHEGLALEAGAQPHLHGLSVRQVLLVQGWPVF